MVIVDRRCVLTSITVAVILVLLLPFQGFANMGIIDLSGTFLPVGVAIGTEYQGIEASLMRYDGPWWLGIYMEAQRHYDEDSYMAGAGVEAGIPFLGFDAAVLGFFREGERLPGFSVRALIAMPFLSLYARYAQVLGADDFFEFGILVKLPFKLT